MGQLTGLNHVMVICEDMDTSINFYVNILGLKVKATTETTMSPSDLESRGQRNTTKLYFLEMPSGTMLVLGQTGKNETPPSSTAIDYYWPGQRLPFTGANRLDHIAFNVEDVATLRSFHQRLIEHGIDVSEVVVRETTPRFVKSIYFYDPDGTPLEVATWDLADPAWDEHRDDNYFLDAHPVTSLPDYAKA
jgi:catechol 2,3-dioxygenase-like lactoylglutathione lyase family enzyme